MIACQDCRYMHEAILPQCHHPRSFAEYPDYKTGQTKTLAMTIGLMRSGMGACGEDAKLFAPKEQT